MDDVGGQDGRLFYEFGQFAPELVLDWQVIETPALVSALREAELDADEFNDSRIRWVSRSERKADVVIAAGVLQLLDDPLEKLRSLLADGPVVLDKVPVVKGGARAGRSSTAVIAWDGLPGVALREDVLTEIARSWSVFEWTDSAVMAFEGSPVTFRGALLRERA